MIDPITQTRHDEIISTAAHRSRQARIHLELNLRSWTAPRACPAIPATPPEHPELARNTPSVPGGASITHHIPNRDHIRTAAPARPDSTSLHACHQITSTLLTDPRFALFSVDRRDLWSIVSRTAGRAGLLGRSIAGTIRADAVGARRCRVVTVKRCPPAVHEGELSVKAQIAERLKTLQNDYEAGQTLLADLAARRTSLTNTLLRIDGAMQVRKEMSADAERAANSAASGAAVSLRAE